VVSVYSDQGDPNPDNNRSSYNVDVTPSPFPLTVKGVQLVTGLRSINAIVITFNLPLDPVQAVNPINYAVLKANRHFKFTVPVPLQAPAYDPKAQTVTLTPTRPLSLGTPYQLQINGQGSAGVTDLAGNLLVGNTSANPNSPYYLQISRGLVPPAPKPQHGGKHVSLVESVTARRVLTGPANTTSGVAAALPPLNESTTFQNTLNTNPSS
jgi:hypothetical protein